MISRDLGSHEGQIDIVSLMGQSRFQEITPLYRI